MGWGGMGPNKILEVWGGVGRGFIDLMRDWGGVDRGQQFLKKWVGGGMGSKKYILIGVG